MDKQANEELLPCPECGHKTFNIRPTKTTVSCQVSIKCMLCSFMVSMDSWSSLVRYWNTREKPPVVALDKQAQIDEMARTIAMLTEGRLELSARHINTAMKLIELGYTKSPLVANQSARIPTEEEIKIILRLNIPNIDIPIEDRTIKQILNLCEQLNKG